MLHMYVLACFLLFSDTCCYCYDHMAGTDSWQSLPRVFLWSSRRCFHSFLPGRCSYDTGYQEVPTTPLWRHQSPPGRKDRDSPCFEIRRQQTKGLFLQPEVHASDIGKQYTSLLQSQQRTLPRENPASKVPDASHTSHFWSEHKVWHSHTGCLPGPGWSS